MFVYSVTTVLSKLFSCTKYLVLLLARVYVYGALRELGMLCNFIMDVSYSSQAAACKLDSKKGIVV